MSSVSALTSTSGTNSLPADAVVIDNKPPRTVASLPTPPGCNSSGKPSKEVADRVCAPVHKQAEKPQGEKPSPDAEITAWVFDTTTNKKINLDPQDLVGDESHGGLVSKVIHSMAPEVEIKRIEVEFNDVDHIVDQLVRGLSHIESSVAREQGVSNKDVRLHGQVVNWSLAASGLTSEEKQRLARAVTDFTQRGGRLYVGMGNDYPSEFTELGRIAGVTLVDGSEGSIGDEPVDRKPSKRYDNDDLTGTGTCTSNSVVHPDELPGGGVDINQDGVSDYEPKELSPRPQATWLDKALPKDGVIHGNALRDLYLQQRAQIIEDEAHQEQMAAERRPHDEIESWGEKRREQIQSRSDAAVKGKLVTLEAFQHFAGSKDPGLWDKLQLSGVDPKKVYVDADAAYEADESRIVFYEVGNDGLLKPLSSDAGAAPVVGTSFATPGCLVEMETKP